MLYEVITTHAGEDNTAIVQDQAAGQRIIGPGLDPVPGVAAVISPVQMSTQSKCEQGFFCNWQYAEK